MGVEPPRTEAERTHGRGPRRATGAPSGGAPVEDTRGLPIGFKGKTLIVSLRHRRHFSFRLRRTSFPRPF